MKKKLLDRRGAAIELAILMIVVCFSLSILVMSTSLLQHERRLRLESNLKQSVALEQAGQDFLSAVISGGVNENWLPDVLGDFIIETEHQHSWEEEITTPATCTEAGLKTRTCRCGETETEEIPAAHTWGAGEVTTEATCTAGTEKYTCTTCSETKEEPIPQSEHAWALDEATSKERVPCKEDGAKDGVEHYICADCGAEDTKVIEKHTWDEGVVTTEATCTNTGVMTYTCSDCAITRTEEIPVNDNHSWTPEGCTACGAERPTVTYCLVVYKTGKDTVRIEVTTSSVSDDAEESTETLDDTIALKVIVFHDVLDRTYTITEWTKNDRS